MKSTSNIHNNNLQRQSNKKNQLLYSHTVQNKVSFKNINMSKKQSPFDSSANKSSNSLNKAQEHLIEQQAQKRAKLYLEQIKTKFVNLLMRNGEKSKALSLFMQFMNLLEKKNILIAQSIKNRKNLSLEQKSIHTTLCENTDTLFKFHTSYKNSEKDGLFEKNKRLTDTKDTKDTNSDNKNNTVEKRIKYKGIEEYYYNNFLKNNILYTAIENVKPPLELRRVRKGGTTYQVPAIVPEKRQERLAIKWIIQSACKRKSKNSFSESLVIEVLEAFNKTGQVRQKRDEQLKIAEFNRSYTRYRWW